MIRSMTGYGSAVLAGAHGEFMVEVKSLNNRFLDLNVRMPKELAFLELALREEVKRAIRRGKVDLFVRWTPAPGAPPPSEINAPLLRHYAGQLRDALGELAPQAAAGLLNLPGVVVASTAAAGTEDFERMLISAAREALGALDTSRASEGRELAGAIEGHLDTLKNFRDEAAAAKDELQEAYAARLRERIEELVTKQGLSPDSSRLETEIALAADRADVTEELVRLDAHITSFRKLCRSDSPEPIGKTMDFLSQELLREVNTLGNKVRGLSITSRVVEMKSEIEKIKEQIQNLE
ncbi:MAG: YicC family protein [Candidatus Sumerlaeaceae bacterium]|nr:YicC family protein [Candidatus Sumerlaeaceae bacterium]